MNMNDDHYLMGVMGLFAGICSIGSFLLGISHVIGFYPAIVSAVFFFIIFLILSRSFTLRAPVFCTRTDVNVKIKDPSGKTVKVEKTQKFIALRPNITRLEEHVTSDGTIISAQAELESEGSSLRRVSKSSITQVWFHDFDQELRRFRRYIRKFSVTYQDSFTSDYEYYDTTINYPGKDLFVKVWFPVDRHPTLVRRIETVGATVLSRGELQLKNWKASKEFFVEWHIRCPIVGHKCTIEWHW